MKPSSEHRVEWEWVSRHCLTALVDSDLRLIEERLPLRR
jgi:hypothetical protein